MLQGVCLGLANRTIVSPKPIMMPGISILLKTTTPRKSLVLKKFLILEDSKTNIMSDLQNQYNCSSTEKFRFIKRKLWNSFKLSKSMKSYLDFCSFLGIPRTKKNKNTVSKTVQSLQKSVFSQVLLRSTEEKLSDEHPALCPPLCPQNHSTRRVKICQRISHSPA